MAQMAEMNGLCASNIILYNRGNRVCEFSDAAISAMFIAPAVTPWKNTLPGVKNGSNNPGIRIFEYNSITLELQV